MIPMADDILRNLAALEVRFHGFGQLNRWMERDHSLILQRRRMGSHASNFTGQSILLTQIN